MTNPTPVTPEVEIDKSQTLIGNVRNFRFEDGSVISKLGLPLDKLKALVAAAEAANVSWVNLDTKKSRKGNLYCAVNSYNLGQLIAEQLKEHFAKMDYDRGGVETTDMV